MSHSVAVDSPVFTPPGGFIAWFVCLSAGLFFLYEFFQLNIFDVINQPLRDDFHMDATQLSWMSSAYLWANILFLLPAGLILDVYSTRRIILTAMFICVTATLGFACTDSLILASFYRFLSGIGNAFCFLSCVVLAARWFPSRKQALVIGCLVTMAFIGGMIAHTPFAYLNELLGWRKALLTDGLVGAILWLWMYATLRDKPDNFPPEGFSRREKIMAQFFKALFNRQNWLAGLFTCFLNLPIMVLCALWGASYLQVVHQLPDMAASNVISLIFLGSVIGCPLFGWLSDSLERRKPLMLIGSIATFFTLLPLFSNLMLSQSALSILFFALGFFTSTQVISYPLVAESNPAQSTGAATAVASLLVMGGAGVGQIVFGWLMAHHAGRSVSTYAVSDFQFAMCIFPLTTILSFLAVLMARETYCKRAD